MRVGVVSGRRRHGEGYLLRRLAAAAEGLHHQARELERPLALQVFARDVADHLGYDPDSLRFDSWETGLRVALGVTRPGARGRRRTGAGLLVLDELPSLLTRSPEIPAVLQLLHDETAGDPEAPRPSVIVRGSALSVTRDLLTGAQPLRGRAQVELPMPAVDYREARDHWGIRDPLVAFHVDAVLGGAPGYRSLVTEEPPRSIDDLPGWLGRTVLDPASALFDEKAFLLREDPRNLDRALHDSVLQAVADGKHSPTTTGGVVGRDHNGLEHPLEVLGSAGFLVRSEDVLTAQVLGPHFEHVARTWTSRYSGDRWGTPVGASRPRRSRRGPRRGEGDEPAHARCGTCAGWRACGSCWCAPAVERRTHSSPSSAGRVSTRTSRGSRRNDPMCTSSPCRTCTTDAGRRPAPVTPPAASAPRGRPPPRRAGAAGSRPRTAARPGPRARAVPASRSGPARRGRRRWG